MRSPIRLKIRETEVVIDEGEKVDSSVDAIVFPTSDDLLSPLGVGKKILEMAGEEIKRECEILSEVEPGGAVMTAGGNLPVKSLIHIRGPEKGSEEGDKQLVSAVREALALSERNNFAVISFFLTKDDFSLPDYQAARILLTEIQRYIQGGTKLSKIIISLNRKEDFSLFVRELQRCFR